MSKYIYVFLFFFGFIAPALAQKKFKKNELQESRNKGKLTAIHITVGGHLPAADMAKRFGKNGALGTGFELMSANNWFGGVEGHFFFGTDPQEDPLAILRTPEGDIIGRDQALAGVALRERGFYAGVTGGKLITFKKETRSGLRLSLGAGWTQHKFRLQDNTQTVNQITDAYAKGYDRLTGGPALQQFIGWQHLGRLRRTNWIIGLEFNQGFTNTLRSWDFSTMRKLDQSRLDLRFGIRAAWTLPIYVAKAASIYY